MKKQVTNPAVIAKAAEWMSKGAYITYEVRRGRKFYNITWSDKDYCQLSESDYNEARRMMAEETAPAQTYKVWFYDAQCNPEEVKTYHNISTPQDLYNLVLNNLECMKDACLSMLWIEDETGRRWDHNCHAWAVINRGAIYQ